MNYNNRDKKIEERIKEKDKRDDDRQLSIMVSWAINNSTHLTAPLMKNFTEDNQAETTIKEWTVWFLEYYEELRAKEAEKRVIREDDEQAL